MLLRVICKSVGNRKGRFVVAVLAVVMGISVFSALLSIALGIREQAGQELRAYGANIRVTMAGSEPMDFVLASGNARGIPGDTIARLGTAPVGRYLAGYAPFAYSIGETAGRQVMVVGTWFDRVHEVNPWWRLKQGSLPASSNRTGAVLGANVAASRRLKVGDMFTLALGDGHRKVPLRVSGVLVPSGGQDDQVFLSLEELQSLSRLNGAAEIQVSARTSQRPAAQIASELERLIPGSKARVIKQIARAEGIVLDKIEWLLILVTVVVLATSGLSVLSTMTTTVLERRKEVGLLKALGASPRKISTLFYAESALIGLTGGLAGSGLGYLLAQVIGASVFSTRVAFNPGVALVSVAMGLFLALAAAISPVRAALSINAIVTLRGD